MAEDRCNFLVFVADQFSSFSLALNGNPDVKTPNLDRIGTEGVSLTRAYCPNMVCTPSRASLITGLKPSEHGCISNGTRLPEDVPTLTHVLADAGYRTHSVGKIHLQTYMGERPPEDPRPTPFSWEDYVRWGTGEIRSLPSPYYGFQSTDYLCCHRADYGKWLRERDPAVPALFGRDRGVGVEGTAPDCWKLPIPEELHYNRWIAERSIAFLDSMDADQPFFLCCSFPDPHHPFAACAPYSEMYDPLNLTLTPTWDLREDPCGVLRERRAAQRKFDEAGLRQITAQTYGMISHVDDCIGSVLQHLERRGLTERTVVVFLADHGEYLGSHHLLFKSIWPWEQLQRVPFLWRAPGGTPRGTDPAVSSLLDFVPTVLDYAGVDPAVLDRRGRCYERRADPVGLPGRSLRPLIDRSEPLPPRPALIEHDEDGHAGPMVRMRTIVTDRYKLTVYAHHGDGILTDLATDPHETRNLWLDPAHAEVRSRLTAELLDELIWWDRLDQPRISGG